LILSVLLALVQTIPFPGPGRASGGGGGATNNATYDAINSKTCSSGGPTTSYTCTGVVVPSGSTVFVWASGYNGATITDVSDGTNSFDIVSASQAQGNAAGRLFKRYYATGGTFDLTSTYSFSAYPSTGVLIYSGVATSSPLDVMDDNNTGTNASPNGGTVTTTNAADLVLTCATSDWGSTGAGWSNGVFTIRQSEGNGSLYSTYACGEFKATSTGTYGNPFIIASSANWVAVTAAFRSQ
jgi:hypothetical protein